MKSSLSLLLVALPAISASMLRGAENSTTDLEGFEMVMRRELTSCTYGDCIDTNTHDCNGNLYSGYCSGGNNIKCCSGGSSPNPCSSGGGTCINTDTTTCSGSLVSGLCPGPSSVRCCRSGAAPRTCPGGGTCMNSYSDDCSGTFVSGSCPGPNEIKCCRPSSGGGGGGGSSLTYPVTGYSSAPTLTQSRTFGARRNDGSRCHCGCDIEFGTIRAVDAGVVTNVYYFYACSGGSSHAVVVYHQSLDISIVYGEINSNAVYVSSGQSVSKGDNLGYASRCGMLHLETYSGRVTANQRWYPPPGGHLSWGENCATKYPQTKPAALMDCEEFLHSNF